MTFCGGAWPEKEPIKWWCGSRSGAGSRFFYFARHFPWFPRERFMDLIQKQSDVFRGLRSECSSEQIQDKIWIQWIYMWFHEETVGFTECHSMVWLYYDPADAVKHKTSWGNKWKHNCRSFLVHLSSESQSIKFMREERVNYKRSSYSLCWW